MLHSVFGKTLWQQRRALLAWAIGITAVGVFYAAFFPAMNGPEISEAMENIAPELMEALGFTEAHPSPDIDGRVYIAGTKLPVGQFATVKIIGHTDYDLIAK